VARPAATDTGATTRADERQVREFVDTLDGPDRQRLSAARKLLRTPGRAADNNPRDMSFFPYLDVPVPGLALAADTQFPLSEEVTNEEVHASDDQLRTVAGPRGADGMAFTPGERGSRSPTGSRPEALPLVERPRVT